MGNVNQDDRIGLWGYDAGRVTDRAPKIKAFAGGLITDIFAPRDITLAQADKIRGVFNRTNALHLYEHANRPPTVLASDTIADVRRVKASTVELDIELADDTDIADYARQVVALLHKPRPAGLGENFILTINVAPNKASFLPVDLIQEDPFVYVSVQLYYGDMAPVSSWEQMQALIDYGIPKEKCVPMYGAAGPTKGSERHITIPNIFYQGQIVTYRDLRRGRIYQDDLMVEMGLL